MSRVCSFDRKRLCPRELACFLVEFPVRWINTVDTGTLLIESCSLYQKALETVSRSRIWHSLCETSVPLGLHNAWARARVFMNNCSGPTVTFKTVA